MSKRLLPLIPAGLQVEQILSGTDHLTIIVAPLEPSAACPACNGRSSRIHSRYDRILHDLPWQGRPVRLQVRARRFRCLAPDCPRQTFAERPADTAPPAGRRTGRLADLQRHIGLATGGEVGSKLAACLAMPVSADTLLRMARRAGKAPQHGPPIKVLAVDDWAWRRGHRYGTVLVDLEWNRVADLLPDRTAESLAAWLRENPGIAVVARDRAGAYTDGVRQGAPDAIQVTDRWHLLRNRGDAVHAAAERHHAVACRVARDLMAEPPTAGAPLIHGHERPSGARRRSEAALARRQVRFDEAVRLHAAGASLSAISRQVGADRKTLRQWLWGGGMPSWRHPRRGGVLDAYREHLDRRWTEGCHNAARLWRELTELGFTGGAPLVRAWATARRRADPGKARALQTRSGKPWRPLSGRRVVRLLMAEPRTLSRPDRAFVQQLLEDTPALAATVTAAKRIERVLRKQSDETLADVLAAAEVTHLATFVTELRKDIKAVEAALRLPWTTSPAEGQISRIKMIERTMYGRADQFEGEDVDVMGGAH